MELIPQRPAMLPATESEAAKIREFRKGVQSLPQTECRYEHLVHAGMYTRTVYVPAGHLIAGVTLKVPTVTIIVGDVTIYRESGNQRITGYNVIPGSAGRMVACLTHSKAAVTMIFPTTLTDIAEIQKQSTDEYALLPAISNDQVIVTGE